MDSSALFTVDPVMLTCVLGESFAICSDSGDCLLELSASQVSTAEVVDQRVVGEPLLFNQHFVREPLLFKHNEL